MIALSVAKQKMFSPESEIFTVSYPTCAHGIIIIVHDYIQEVKNQKQFIFNIDNNYNINNSS